MRINRLLKHLVIVPLLLSIFSMAALLSCTTTAETEIHLIMGPATTLFPFGVQTASAIRLDIDRADMLVRYALVIRNTAPDNAALLLEEAMAIANASYQQTNISQEQLGNTPYYSSPLLSLPASIEISDLYIDIAEGLYSIDYNDELNRQIMIEALERSLVHLKLIEHTSEHGEELLRLYRLSIQLDSEGTQIRDTCISIAVSYKILPIKLMLLAEMAEAIYPDERLIVNNLLGHFEVAHLQSTTGSAIDMLMANLMILKINAFIPEYQLENDGVLPVENNALAFAPRNLLVQISSYLADVAPQFFDIFYDNPFDTTTKLDILLEYIQSTDSPQQKALYTGRFISEHELLPSATQYRQLHLVLPLVIEYQPDSAQMLIARTASQNYYQSLRAYATAAQTYLELGDSASAQRYFEMTNSRLPTGYPVSDAFNYYAIYERVYGRNELMVLMLTHRTEPTLSSIRLLLLLQSNLLQPFSLQEQQLLAQIVR